MYIWVCGTTSLPPNPNPNPRSLTTNSTHHRSHNGHLILTPALALALALTQWVHVSNDRIVFFWSSHTECECSSEPVPMFLTMRAIVLHHLSYLGPADKGLLYTFPTSKWPFSCARAPTRGTPWAESGILFDEPDVLHSSYPAVSSQILFTTTTYGCLHVERITACHFFYTYT